MKLILTCYCHQAFPLKVYFYTVPNKIALLSRHINQKILDRYILPD